MVTSADNLWDDPETLDDEYAEDVALEEVAPPEPLPYRDPTDWGDGTKTADPRYGQTRRDGADIASSSKKPSFRQWERALRRPSALSAAGVPPRSQRLTGPERDLLSKTDDEIAAEVHEAGQQLRKARTPSTIAGALERFVQLLDDLWKVEPGRDAQPTSTPDVVAQPLLWSDYDRWLVRAVSRRLVEHYGWNQPRARRSRKSHASPEERTRVVWLYIIGRARGMGDRETCRMIVAVAGVKRTTARTWVDRFAEKVPNPHLVRGKPMSEVQTLADARADHEERLQDLERWVGLPVGGRKAIEATVDQWIAESLSTPSGEGTD